MYYQKTNYPNNPHHLTTNNGQWTSTVVKVYQICHKVKKNNLRCTELKLTRKEKKNKKKKKGQQQQKRFN